MGEETEKISAIFPDEISKKVHIVHEMGRSAEVQVEWSEKEEAVIRVTGPDVPDELCRAIVKRLSEIGVEKIELRTWGWWLGEEDDRPEAVQVIDHVACHLPSPLTGTAEAASGEAFINMRAAYSVDDPEDRGICQAILWHTTETGRLSDRETETALGAGCRVASPDAAKWAVCARAAGIEISVMVRIARPQDSSVA